MSTLVIKGTPKFLQPFYAAGRGSFDLSVKKQDELLESDATVSFDNMMATFTYPNGTTFLRKAKLMRRKMATQWINDYNERRQS